MKQSMRRRLSRILAMTMYLVLLIPSLAIPVGADMFYSPNETITDSFDFQLLEEDTEGLLTITKTGDAYAIPQFMHSYTITITNTGDSALSNIVVSDTLDAELEFDNYGNNGISLPGNIIGTATKDDRTVTWTIGSMAAKKSATINIYAKANLKEEPYTVSNYATVVYKDKNNTSYYATSNTVDTHVYGPAATFTKVADKKSVVEGDEITYTLTMRNTGDLELGFLYFMTICWRSIPTILTLLLTPQLPFGMDYGVLPYSLKRVVNSPLSILIP